jgi:hypothetical protein
MLFVPVDTSYRIARKVQVEVFGPPPEAFVFAVWLNEDVVVVHPTHGVELAYTINMPYCPEEVTSLIPKKPASPVSFNLTHPNIVNDVAEIVPIFWAIHGEKLSGVGLPIW